MDKPVCFLKFGEKRYIKGMLDGEFFFSNALSFRRIEENLLIKGQGDKLEGGSVIYAKNMTMIDNQTNEVILTGVKENMFVHYEPANLLPVYCLFACQEKDCTRNEDGSRSFHLSSETISTIKEHFPKADSVVIIDNPEQFVSDVTTSLNTDVKHGLVNYFNLYGFDSEQGKAMDIRYFKYLSQDIKPVKVANGTKYTFSANYVYRSLLCKDVFFENEQEYRFILPEQRITEGKIFKATLNKVLELMDLSEFWKLNV